MAAKVIVLGSVSGKLQEAFAKLETLHRKQNFSFAIVTGNLFSASQDDEAVHKLLDGTIRVPLTTYFTVGTTPLPDAVVRRILKDEDVCENLHYLGKRSTTKTSDGIRIVTLGGVLDASIVGGQSQDQHLPFHTVSDAKALRGANTADILLTTSWPAGVTTNSTVAIAPEDKDVVLASEEIAELCTALKPRYHFSASPTAFFYEREPFLHPLPDEETDSKAITRFLSLAPFGNSTKAKALYAFNITPGESITSVPPGCTPSPFLSHTRKRHAPDDEGQFSRFDSSHDRRGGGRHKKSKREPPPGPDRCFFCLSNVDIDQHMICCIGSETYVTTAKGPLPGQDYFVSSGLDFPCHQLIIPFSHEPTFQAMGAEADNVFNEMTRFKEALQAMVANQSKFKLGTVTWEISRRNGIHTHWQFLPVSHHLIRKGLVEAAFQVEADNLKYPKFQETALGSATNESSDFFRVWIWSDDGETGIQSKELVMRIDDSFRFDLQFGRKVMAKLLGLEARLLWRDVVQSTAEELEDVEKFKAAFKPWDFSLEG
ncbi:CwfJ C-terminus 2-domain-containing protein-like protein [Xylaria bambusicola]|uniref:CwfJ C-terminus 2-domain-containing protein-like protein n=1 Tax=Xylaria bambusicola TaxID=326684 RepID=UPI0020080C0F|nr:CwfJ C-terminus 2-domain-containing protein-like protein [Xylaria bambusicola]KAI0508630.1 CwfJ C-terminus 2-domain-containing protein-like protein [Xylaria bambusicola]